MIGRRFGNLTVIEFQGKRGSRNRKHYLCKCDCGNERIVCELNLKSGHTQSCGCLKNKASGRRINLSGKRFGKLTAVKFLYNNDKGTTMWLCRCDCGNEIEVSYNNLKSGNTQSCGCWHELHKESNSRLYKCWRGIKQRCENTNDSNYPRYGGRGIVVCDEWRNSYLSFRKWALENGYSDNLTIDRINVDGNYEPSNCRWTTMEVQQNNRRDNVYVEYRGERLTLKQLTEKYAVLKGISYKTLWYRFSVLKWDIEKCIKTPLLNK